VGYPEISDCLGWSTGQTWMDMFTMTYCWAICVLIGYYVLTNLADFKGKQFTWRVGIISCGSVVVASGPAFYPLLRPIATIPMVFLGLLFLSLTPIPMLSLGLLFMRYLSIKWTVSMKWAGCFIGIGCLVNALVKISGESVDLVNHTIVYMPLILTGLETIFSKVLERAFKDHRDNELGITTAITWFEYQTEKIRFITFLAQYIGYKHDLKTLGELLENIAFSILGEIWTHSGLHEVGQKWVGQRVWFINEVNTFPEIRGGISSIRQILEFVCPLDYLFCVFTLNMLRDCIPLNDNVVDLQINFFTTEKLMKDIWEVLGVYYSIELFCLLLCRLIAKFTLFKEESPLRSLKHSHLVAVTLFMSGLGGDKSFGFIRGVLGDLY